MNRTGIKLDLLPKLKNVWETQNVAKISLKILFTYSALSIKKLSVDVGISYSLCRDILLKDLCLKPYKYQSAHQLLPLDYEKRFFFAQWWLGLAKSAHKWLIASDEAYFYLTESINKQNNRMWLKERPVDWIKKPLHDEKVLVGCGISCLKIYGPYFFEESVNQHNYLEMLKKFFWPKHS